MLIADLDGDGIPEVVLVSDTHVRLFHWQEGRLLPLAEFRAPTHIECFRPVAYDVSGDGTKDLIINGYDRSDNMPVAFVLQWRDGRLTMLHDRIRFYLNTVRLPPTFREVLVGQQGDHSRVFRPGVHEMRVQGGRFTQGGRLSLPDGANVFNFAWLPANRDSRDGDRLLIIRDTEHIATYTERGTRIALTSERYSGARLGLHMGTEFPGMGTGGEQTGGSYFVPMNMIVADLERSGVYTALINHPISTAAQLFENFRTFPQGEIHALYWDGVGLSLQWKTQRIRGSVVDQALVDITGNGNLDLVLNVNTFPGATGTGARRTLLLVYPLNVTGDVR
jgi:hypothetical protein